MSNDDNKAQSKPLLSKGDLDQEESETANFDSIDRRPKETTGSRFSSFRDTAFSALDAVRDEKQNPSSSGKKPKLSDLLSKMKASKKNQHKHKSSDASELLRSMSDEAKTSHILKNVFAKNGNDSKLFSHVENNDDDEDDNNEDDRENDKDGGLPFKHQDTTPHYGSYTERALSLPSIATKSGWRKLRRMIRQFCTLPRLWRAFRVNILQSAFVLAALPLFASALVLYYAMGNPEIDFLPGHATLSWWCNFAGRQIMMFELARLCQWFTIDIVMLGTRLALRFFGPLLTLFSIQAKGWPCLVVLWALLDILFLHGDNKFQVHWLYWTDFGIYSEGNSGSYILNGDAYFRILICMLVAGSATAVKRCAVAVRFGMRQFSEFKPRLERILSEIVVLNEIASLAQQASELDEETLKEIDIAKIRAAACGIADVRFDVDDPNASLSDADDLTTDVLSKGGNGWSKLQQKELRIKEDLDRWDEPINKGDKEKDMSISDVLKFKRALTYMDEKNPFGQDYGPGRTRDECILSAHNVFYNLLKLTPKDDTAIPIEALELLSINDDGKDDLKKKKHLKKMFQPDRNNEVPLLAFVQTCDATYKMLRYFRASVRNASVIDNVLESIVNGAFFFVLGLLLLSLLQYNPWALLLSLTSLLVSVSFALGPSVSKYVEGVLLIAIQRPYDLGDRICIGGPEASMGTDTSSNSWFVEDINLTTTTLRYAITNEVCTLNNGSIFGTRIVNCNRSPNAMISFSLKLHISILEKDKLNTFRDKLDDYVSENPRTWENVAFCRHDEIDADNDIVSFAIAFRHRHSWQDAARIKVDRASLIKYVHDVTTDMDIALNTSPPKRIIYNAGVLEHVDDGYDKNLLRPDNIVSHLEAEKRKANM